MKAFIAKNKIGEGNSILENLDFSDFYLEEGCEREINSFLEVTTLLTSVKLSKNLIDPRKLIRLEDIK